MVFAVGHRSTAGFHRAGDLATPARKQDKKGKEETSVAHKVTAVAVVSDCMPGTADTPGVSAVFIFCRRGG